MNATDATNALIKISEFISPWGTHVFRNICNYLFRTSMPYILTSPLPAELWAIILDMALVDIFLPKPPSSISCDTFPDYYYNWNPRQCSNYLRHCNIERRNLRLVCRTWANLIDLRWTLHKELSSINNLTDGTRTRSIGLGHVYRWYQPRFLPMPIDQKLFAATRGITAISVGSPHSNRKIRDNDHIKRKFIDFLFTYSGYFPYVDTFSLTPRGDISIHFKLWSTLERSFPNLVSLRLEGEHKRRAITTQDLDRHLTLPHLEILITGLKQFPNCSFPSLKHLVIPDMVWCINSSPSNNHSYFRLLYGHRENLESLIITGHSRFLSPTGEAFWDSFPKLRLFGTPDSRWPHFPLPKIPLNNSIEHLMVANLSPNYQAMRNILLDISNLPRSRNTPPNVPLRFPSLRYVTCDQYGMTVVEKRILRRQCAELGIELRDIVVRARPAKAVPDMAFADASRTLVDEVEKSRSRGWGKLFA